MKKLMYMLVAISAFMIITSCNKADVKEEEIRIGAIYPKTGNLALLGQESLRGATLAVDEINANGGIDGKKVRLISTDAGTADAATLETTRLITKEKVNLFVGSFASSLSIAATEVTERNDALFFEMGAVANEITQRGYKNLIRINPKSEDGSQTQLDFTKEIVAKHLNKDYKKMKVAMIYEDSAFGSATAATFEESLKKDPLNVVLLESYSAASNDLSSIIIKLKKAEPDFLIMTSYVNDAILLSKQAEELDYELPIVLGNGSGHSLKDYQNSVGELADGVFGLSMPDINLNENFTKGLPEYIKAYEDKYKKPPQSGLSVANYVGMKVVLQAIENAGSTDLSKVKKAALDIKIPRGETANGWGVDFDEKTGQNKLGDFYFTQWIDGKLYTVYPKEVSVKEIDWTQ